MDIGEITKFLFASESFTADIVSRMVEDSDANKNLVISPMSIFTALAMVGKGNK